jgi:hypothetical protein
LLPLERSEVHAHPAQLLNGRPGLHWLVASVTMYA